MIKIFEIIKRKKKDENIIKKEVNILSIKDDIRVDFNFDFEFKFFKDTNGKKKAIISINKEKVILEDGQSCIFIMKSGDFDPIRLKAKPDFEKEGCQTTWCHDPKIKDEDL